MKKLVIFGFLSMITLILFSSCNWEKDVMKDGIKYEKMRYILDGNDTIGIYGKLAQNTIIDGFPCKADWVELSMDNELRDFCLSEDFVVKNVSLTEGTWVFIGNVEKMVCVFPEDTEIQGYLCQGGGGKKGIHTSFYPSGKLKSFYPVNDVQISGINCKSSLLNNVELYENGSLKYCKLAKKQEINTVVYDKNTVLNFDKNLSVLPSQE